MSVIKKQPWIEIKLGQLETSELKELLTKINSSAQISALYSLYDGSKYIPEYDEGETDITNCIIEFEKGKHPYTGFLIYNSDMCIFIAYHRFQDLALFEINNVAKTYTRINEECSIEELRRIINDILIEAGEIDLSNYIKRHEFEEGTELTDEILAEVKSGDIIKVANMEFVVNNKVNQSPRSITGKMVGVVSETSITIAKLDWIKGETLEPELITMNAVDGAKIYLHELSFSMTSDSVADHTIKVLSKSSTEITLANITTTLADGNIISAQLNRSDKMLFSLVVDSSSVNLSVITQAIGALGFQTMDIAQATYLKDTVDDLID